LREKSSPLTDWIVVITLDILTSEQCTAVLAYQSKFSAKYALGMIKLNQKNSWC
jgi:hypothetical protein